MPPFLLSTYFQSLSRHMFIVLFTVLTAFKNEYSVRNTEISDIKRQLLVLSVSTVITKIADTITDFLLKSFKNDFTDWNSCLCPQVTA